MSRQQPQAARQQAERRGHLAEARAAMMLRLKGYRILDRRWKSPAGELDLVIRRGNAVAFVEVKTRSSADEALASVSPRQRRRIVAAAHHWLAANPANADLSAMRVAQYVLGVEQFARPDLKIRVEAYAKTYDEYAASLDRTYLVMANTGAGFEGAEQNFESFGFDRLTSGGTGRSLGIELLVQKKLSEIPAYGIASVTFSETRFTGLDGIERAGSFDQRVLVNISGGYQFDERWEASLRFRLATGAPYTPFNADGSQSQARYNTERFPVAHSLDLRVDRRWNFAGWSLIGYVDIQNVYNNPVVSSVRWDPRTQQQVFNESIGILPSIGVSAEF